MTQTQDQAQSLAAMVAEAEAVITYLRQRAATLNLEVQFRDAQIRELQAQVASLTEQQVSSEAQPTEGEVTPA